MAISFPTPNLGDPSTLTTTQAGITWTWNDTLKVWSTEGGSSGGGASVSVGENPPTGASQGDLWWNDSVDSYRLFIYTGTEWVDASPQGQEGSGGGLTQAEGDARYLSALSDDTAAGAITFEAGVNVTGGRVLADGSDVQLIRAEQTGAKDSHTGFWASAASGSSTTGTTRGYFASATLAVNSDGADTIRGFESNISIRPGQENNYNFYASGDAPNYFAGATFIGSVNTSMANTAGVENGWVFAASGRAGSHVSLSSANDNISNLMLWRHTSNKGTFLDFRYSSVVGNGGDNLCGRIKGNGNNAVNYEDTSDYRLKQNIQPLGTAVDLVKQLKPSTFEYINEPGVTYQGFVAHELQDICPLAVSGTKDETQVVGTLTDLDGNAEENVPEPTVVPAGSTFTATGTEELYQGVDQRRLIPLLTKALQEALTRIEELESNTLQPLYATEADLPSASEHHGKTAHVHATGSLYFAHAGNWVKLQNA